MRASTGGWDDFLGRRDLPTYVGGWLAAASWLAAVGSTIGDATFNVLILVLTSIGFAVSFWLRGYEQTDQWPAIKRGMLGPSVVVRTAFMLAFVLPGLANTRPFSALVPDVARASAEWLIGSGFMWAMALYSFGLVSDGLVAFGSVLGLSMLGLMASSNVNPELGVAFLFYLLGNVLMLSNMTLAHHSPVRQERTSGSAMARWVGDQIIVAGIAVAGTAVLAIGVAALLQLVSPRGLLAYLHVPANARGPSAVSHSFAAFEDRMELGVGNPNLPQSPMFTADNAEPGLLWRRRVYDRYVARMWQTTAPASVPEGIGRGGRVVLRTNAEDAAELAARRRIEPRIRAVANGLRLAAPPLVTEIHFLGGAVDDQVYVDKFNSPDVRLPANSTVEVVCDIPIAGYDELREVEDIDADDWGNYVQVPYPARRVIEVEERRIVDDTLGPYDRAVQIEQYLQAEFRYDLAVSIPEHEYDDAMEFFLAEKRGACDLIATAMALLARQSGIPARVAVGYSGGEPQSDGVLLIRASHAHAWAELYFQGYGWLAFNPAVPGTATPETGQVGGAATGGGGRRIRPVRLLMFCLAAWLIGYGSLQVHRRRPMFSADPGGEVAKAYHAARRALRRRAQPRRAYETPRAYYDRLRSERSGAAWLVPFERLTALYERQRYGLGPIGVDEVQASIEAAREVRRWSARDRFRARR